jgi:hypothetical protein
MVRSNRGQQPGRAVADDQQRAAQALLTQIGEEPFPCVTGLGGRGVQPDEHGLALGSDAQAASTGSAAALAWYLKCEPSRNRWSRSTSSGGPELAVPC